MATSAKGATSIAGTSAGKALASALSTYGTTNIGGKVGGTQTTTASTPTTSNTSNLQAGFYKDTAGNVREYSPGFTNPSYFQGATYLGTSEKLAPAPKAVTAINADDAIKDYSKKVADINALSDQIAQQKAATSKTSATTTNAPKLTSVVDYLASQGQPSDFASRSVLAKQYGIQGYAGTAQQNMQLLNILQNQPKKDNTADLLKAATNAKYQPVTPTTPATPTTTPTTPTTPATPTTPVQKSEAMQEYEKAGNDYLTQLDNTYTNMQADLDKVRNGTFPLSVSDQTILDQTQKAIERQKQMQIDANDTYQKAIEVAGVSSGRARYAPELQAGNLANAVNSGIQKIADIESQGALIMAKLQQSIDEKNYTMVKDYYASLQSVLKEKTNTLMAMQQAVMANEKDLRDYNYKVAQDAIQNIYQNKQLDWQMKNAEANRVLEQSKFDWQKTMDLKNYNLAVQKASVDNNLNELLSVTEAKALGVPYGTTKGQAIQAGKVPGAGEASQSVRNIVSNLDELMSKYKTLDWRSKGIVGGSIGEQIQSQKFNPADQAFETQRNLMGMELARLFEKGRMSDQDRAFYLALMPSRSMESASAEASAKELKRLLSYQLVSGKPPSLASNEIESLDNSKPPGNYLVMDYSTGNLGYIPTNEYDPSKYLNFSD